ncbi:MAG: amino acid adenylation domain-containing protein [Chlorobium sp.]|nr:MAG: amino acid adenylation domain-containing protein [Chlorobium sp.]
MNIPDSELQALYPLSSVQREIWCDQSLYPDTPVYNVGCYNQIEGELDLQIFREAITLMVEETDAMRLKLSEVNGVPLQSFPPMPQVTLTIFDFPDDANPLQRALSSIRNVVNQPFRIFEEPLFRHHLYKLPEHYYIWSHTYHHLVVDRWATSLIIQKVSAHYNALLKGESLPRGVNNAYQKFIVIDTAGNESASFNAHRRYWMEKFSTLPAPLFSPLAGYGDRMEIIKGGVHTTFLPRPQYERLNSLARLHSVSLFHLLLGILYVYFTRVQDQDECVIGLPLLNRHTPAFKKTIGLFVTMIPERFAYGRQIHFIELIKAIAKTLRESYHSQCLPASEINRLTGVLQTARKRVFDLTFSFEKLNCAATFGSSHISQTVAVVHEYEQTPLAIFVRDYSGNKDIQIDFAYNLAYFNALEIERIKRRLMHLMEEVLSRPEEQITQLELLPPAESQQLLTNWNATDSTLPENHVHQMFEAHAAKNPHAVAVVFENERLTYNDVNEKANHLANTLIALGVEADRPVAIALERSPAMIVAVMAILKAGGAYLPLDPSYPLERLRFMLEDSNTRILITAKSLHDKLHLAAQHTLYVDDDERVITTQPIKNPDLEIDPQQLAYIIYTSGSTGTPKGVAIAHCGLANLACAQISSFAIGAKSRVLQFASFSFDASVSEIFMALCAGAELHLPNDEQRLPGLSLLHYLDEAAITHLTLPPTVLAALPQYPLPVLESLIVAGEPSPPALVSYWSKGRRLFNAYGPTEATVCATIAECHHSCISADTPLSIGRPIANVRIYILDRHLQPTPTGVVGELHIGGVGLARNYLNRPELTAEKFISDPFSRKPGARLYKSGDLARYRPDGNIEFLGRIDHQIKIRGFRIEPGEIECALTAHPSIREALIISRTEKSGQTRLVAYVVSPEALLTSAELRAFLKITLPDYMLPGAFVFLQAMPMTPNGKIDRHALPEPEAFIQSDSVAPIDTIEEILVDIWATLFQQNRPGVHDNFFELGGESLLATKLASMLRDATGISIPIRWIFEAPTPFELAGRIRRSGHKHEALVTIPANRILPGTTRITTDLLSLPLLSQTDIDKVVQSVEEGASNVQDIYPLTQFQEGMLFHYQLQSDSDLYLSHQLFSIDSLERCEAFIAALQSVIDRHDILRTAFVWKQLPEPLQVVWRHARLAVDVLHFNPEEGFIANQLMESFHPRQLRLDLTHAPLLRIAIAKDGKRWLMLLIAHHLVMDQWSMEIMFEEIRAYLKKDTKGLKTPVPFRNFIANMRGEITNEAHETFFRNMLNDIKSPTTPFGLLDVQGDGSRIVEAHRTLPLELALRLRSQARCFSATPATIFHLAWALILSRCCNQENVVFGTVLLGRMQGGEGVERALGLFINTLPFRVTCSARKVSEALRDTQHRLLALMLHEYASLSMAQRCSAVPVSTPLFSSLLNYRQGGKQNDVAFDLEGIELIRHTEERTNYPISLSIDDLKEGFGLTVQIDASIDPERICNLMQYALETLVTALEEAPETPLSLLEILPQEEQEKIMADRAGSLQKVSTSLPREQNRATTHPQRQSGTL